MRSANPVFLRVAAPVRAHYCVSTIRDAPSTRSSSRAEGDNRPGQQPPRRRPAPMNPVIIALLALLGVGLLLVFWLVGIYNGLVVARNRFVNAFAQIDVQLKRRYDLV